MVILTNVSLQFDGNDQYLENALRQAMGIADLWTITIWMKPFEVSPVFDSEGRPSFRPDGRSLLHLKGLSHRNEVLIWGERIDNSNSEEYIMVENWDESADRIRVTRFNMAQKRKEWRLFSCAWNGNNLIAWDNGLEITDYNETFSGTGGFIMADPTESGRQRSGRIAVAYTGVAQSLEGPRIVAYSGLLGPIGVWNDVLDGVQLGEIVSGTFGFDLSADSGTYSSSANLKHWWRLGADEDDIGKDYVSTGNINMGTDATATGVNIVVDSP